MKLDKLIKRKLGWVAGSLAIILTVYLVLGLFSLVPLKEYYILGESVVRFLSGCAVFCYLLAAWAFWEI